MRILSGEDVIRVTLAGNAPCGVKKLSNSWIPSVFLPICTGKNAYFDILFKRCLIFGRLGFLLYHLCGCTMTEGWIRRHTFEETSTCSSTRTDSGKQ